MVTYLKDGQDFGPQHFDRAFGFQKSADAPRARGGSTPDNNRAEAVRTRSGTNFQPRDPGSMNMNDRSYKASSEQEIAREPKRKGGRVAKAMGGPMPGQMPMNGPMGPSMPGRPVAAAPVPMQSGPAMMNKGGRIRRVDGGSANGTPQDWTPQKRDAWIRENSDFQKQQAKEAYDDEASPGNHAHGGRIRKAIGGVIPGQAPAAGMQPLTRQPTSAPMPGNPLAKATVSMPASDLSNLATGAARVGAVGALGAVARAAHSGARPVAMPGAPAMAPGAQRPMPAPQGLGGVAGAQPPVMAAKGGFIKDAVTRPGRMTRAAKRAGVSTHEYMESHKHSSDPSLRAAANLGLRLTGGDLSPHKRKR